MMKPSRGDGGTTLILILALLGATQLVPNWRLSRVFSGEDKAHIAQLEKERAEQTRLRVEAERARTLAETTKVEERAALETQVRGAQQMEQGAVLALQRIPDEHRTKEVVLASSFLTRSGLRLAHAIGGLPKEQGAEIVALVDDLLSDAQARVDAANATLAAKDQEAKLLAAERDRLRVEVIPKLERAANDRAAEVKEVERKVGDLTTQVADKARQYEEKDRQAGSAEALLYKVLAVVGVVFATWFFFAFVAPGILKTMKPGTAKNLLRSVAGHTTSPILYRDASLKLKSKLPSTVAGG